MKQSQHNPHISKSDKVSNRMEWIDISKGITILLVVFGHGTINNVLRGAIYSFHMPLFFILSGITYKLSQNNDEFIRKTEKSFKHLIIPAVSIFILRTIIDFFNEFLSGILYNADSFIIKYKNLLATFITGSGTVAEFGEMQISAIGIPWFLFVLFLGRQMFDYIHLRCFSYKTMIVACSFLSIIGVCLGNLSGLPFSFDIALAILPLFFIGKKIEKVMQSDTTKILGISFVVWSVLLLLSYCVSSTYLEFADRRYPLFPLCYVCAIAGTLFVGALSQIISKYEIFSKPLKYIGRNSIYLLFIHCFDKYFSFLYNLTGNGNVNAIIRVLVDVLIFAAVMLLVEQSKKTHTAE